MSNSDTPENSVKWACRDYLNLLGIFHFPLVAGPISYKGAPDRAMHFNGKIHWLEFKSPNGRMSKHQELFQKQCARDGVPYHVVKSVDDLVEIIKKEDVE